MTRLILCRILTFLLVALPFFNSWNPLLKVLLNFPSIKIPKQNFLYGSHPASGLPHYSLFSLAIGLVDISKYWGGGRERTYSIKQYFIKVEMTHLSAQNQYVWTVQKSIYRKKFKYTTKMFGSHFGCSEIGCSSLWEKKMREEEVNVRGDVSFCSGPCGLPCQQSQEKGEIRCGNEAYSCIPEQCSIFFPRFPLITPLWMRFCPGWNETSQPLECFLLLKFQGKDSSQHHSESLKIEKRPTTKAYIGRKHLPLSIL